MRVIVQRVSSASVAITDYETQTIGPGMVVFVGYTINDKQASNDWLLKKLLNLRIFSDETGKMNLNIQDIAGEILLVSQFTLYADLNQGNRPSFSQALVYNEAENLYNDFKTKLSDRAKVKTGIFGAEMQVTLTNDGPVTIIIDSPPIA